MVFVVNDEKLENYAKKPFCPVACCHIAVPLKSFFSSFFLTKVRQTFETFSQFYLNFKRCFFAGAKIPQNIF